MPSEQEWIDFNEKIIRDYHIDYSNYTFDSDEGTQTDDERLLDIMINEYINHATHDDIFNEILQLS